MWIAKSAVDRIFEQAKEAHRVAGEYFKQLERISAEHAALSDRYITLVAKRADEIVQIKADLAAARAYNDTYRTEINSLRLQIAAFTAKMTGVEVTVPQISQPAIGYMPGFDFDDLGDAAAAAHGYDVAGNAGMIPVDLTSTKDPLS